MPNTKTNALMIKCVLDGVRQRVNKRAGIRLVTNQEASSDLLSQLDRMEKSHVDVLITTDAATEAVDYRGGKDRYGRTPSQVLRATLRRKYLRAIEDGVELPAWEAFYEQQMSRIIDSVKLNLWLNE